MRSTPRVRAAATAAVFAVVATAGSGCAGDGANAELTTAAQDAESAARSAALALQLWDAHRSTRELASVQLSDTREQTVDALQASAAVADPAGRAQWSGVIASVTEILAALDDAAVAVHGQAPGADSRDAQHRLVVAADALDRIGRR